MPRRFAKPSSSMHHTMMSGSASHAHGHAAPGGDIFARVLGRAHRHDANDEFFLAVRGSEEGNVEEFALKPRTARPAVVEHRKRECVRGPAR